MKFILMGAFLLAGIALLSGIFFFIPDNSGNISKIYSREQIAKQNILTLFRWIENGSFEKTELINASAVIKRELQALKKECVRQKKPCAAVYVCLDNSFFNSLAKGYVFEGDNRQLLNRLFVGSGANTNAAIPRHPWLDTKNRFLDCLENELIICCSNSVGAAKVDLTKPEIFIAPDINSVAGLVEKDFDSVLKSKLSLSGGYRLVHKGSTARGTSLDNTDFDFDILFEKQEDSDKFLRKLRPLLNAVFSKWRLQGYTVLSKYERQVLTRELIDLIVQDKDGIVLMMQIFAGKDLVIYVDRLNAQVEQIKALGGKWEDVRGQIILFKRLVRDVLHSYRNIFGGFDGRECEQFIIQAGSASDYGRKISSIGSFDKAMRWIYKATSQDVIYLQDSKIIKPLVCAPVFWNKLVNAARKYVEFNKIEMSENEFAQLGLPENAR